MANWKETLDYANEKLAKKNIKLVVEEYEDGCYNLIVETKTQSDYYAENYYEDELSDVIFEALADNLSSDNDDSDKLRLIDYYDKCECVDIDFCRFALKETKDKYTFWQLKDVKFTVVRDSVKDKNVLEYLDSLYDVEGNCYNGKKLIDDFDNGNEYAVAVISDKGLWEYGVVDTDTLDKTGMITILSDIYQENEAQRIIEHNPATAVYLCAMELFTKMVG